MDIKLFSVEKASATIDLFVSVFRDVEGEEEGRLIGSLVRDLIATTEPGELLGFLAVERDEVVGAIFFSRLTIEASAEAYLLSPVAVDSGYQKRGIGQALIIHGLGELKSRGAGLVVTYGDPAFYSKVGFCPISDQLIRPPFTLSQPEGWLGQSLGDGHLDAYEGRVSCVAAFDNPVYW